MRAYCAFEDRPSALIGAKLLALSLGSQRYWKDRVVAELEIRNAA